MKRLGLLIVLAAVAAGGVVYTVRHSGSTSNAAVTTLLPRNTVVLIHLPDFNRTRNDWHQTDLYKIYEEPAVREFLNRPLSKVPQRHTASETIGDLEKLSPKDAFVAVTSIDQNSPHFVGGFRFRGSQLEAEKIIGKWRSKIGAMATVSESVDYQQHKIDIAGTAPNQIATVYDGEWFFASNDLAELKAGLDRVDGRDKNQQALLRTDETFRAAMAHMPSNYALLFYVQPQGISQKLRAAIGASGNQNGVVEQIRSICGATRFDSGKMRDVLFVGVPQTEPDWKLTRSSLNLGTADTFLYLATLINPTRLAGLNQGILPTGTWIEKVFDATARAGVTADDWKEALDLELQSLADWAPDSRWPSIIVTMRVKDFARARKLADALTHGIDEDATWAKTEKNGVTYFSMQTPTALFAITPTVALSQQALIVGLDQRSVELAINRMGQSPSGFVNSPAYKTATHAVAPPSGAFFYVDTALLYSRLDASLRPMLLMSAAFMPGMADYVDVNKLPPPEIVAKHLSPIVSSQRYDGDGYVTESVGPVTLSEMAIGVVIPAVFGAKSDALRP
ncbi:MAG TPA: hypothetical protein VJ721_09370 [Chthoniobacterales bacterium]|nr:hypothetical protein [Chthoniobacterales bacterium]